MSKQARKKLSLATEVVRSLSRDELDAVAGGMGWREAISYVIGTNVTCFGKTGLCHGPDSEALPKAKR